MLVLKLFLSISRGINSSICLLIKLSDEVKQASDHRKVTLSPLLTIWMYGNSLAAAMDSGRVSFSMAVVLPLRQKRILRVEISTYMPKTLPFLNSWKVSGKDLPLMSTWLPSRLNCTMPCSSPMYCSDFLASLISPIQMKPSVIWLTLILMEQRSVGGMGLLAQSMMISWLSRFLVMVFLSMVQYQMYLLLWSTSKMKSMTLPRGSVDQGAISPFQSLERLSCMVQSSIFFASVLVFSMLVFSALVFSVSLLFLADGAAYLRELGLVTILLNGLAGLTLLLAQLCLILSSRWATFSLNFLISSASGLMAFFTQSSTSLQVCFGRFISTKVSSEAVFFSIFSTFRSSSSSFEMASRCMSTLISLTFSALTTNLMQSAPISMLPASSFLANSNTSVTLSKMLVKLTGRRQLASSVLSRKSSLLVLASMVSQSAVSKNSTENYLMVLSSLVAVILIQILYSPALFTNSRPLFYKTKG